jgi:hypothetical protein
MGSLKFHPGLPYPTFLRYAGGPPLKHPYGFFSGGLPARVGGLWLSFTPPDAPRHTPMSLGGTLSSVVSSFCDKKKTIVKIFICSKFILKNHLLGGCNALIQQGHSSAGLRELELGLKVAPLPKVQLLSENEHTQKQSGMTQSGA